LASGLVVPPPIIGHGRWGWKKIDGYMRLVRMEWVNDAEGGNHQRVIPDATYIADLDPNVNLPHDPAWNYLPDDYDDWEDAA